MDKEEGDYIKASDYDRASQQHNRRVFVRRLQRRPWQAFVLSGLCCRRRYPLSCCRNGQPVAEMQSAQRTQR